MTTQFLQQPGGQIAYDLFGESGPLVVLVPSMGDLRAEYRFLIPQLVQAGYRVASMDVRGHGESSTEWADFSVAGVGSDILALIQSLDLGPAYLVGTSMAAGAGVWAAAEAPEQIRGMVLIGPFVHGEGSWLSKLLFSALFTRPWGPAMWKMYYAKLYPTHQPDDFVQYQTALFENLKAPGRMEALQAMIRAPKTASGERLNLVKTPTLVLMGTRDPDFKQPEVEARWVADSLHGRCTMIEDAGHYPHAEMPEVTGHLIISFLQSVDEGSYVA